MGISGQIDELVDPDRFHSDPIPIIRRFSGGGTVIVDEQTLFVTFIFNAGALAIPAFPEPIMRWTEQLYQPVFHPHPFKLQENDYVMGTRKFGGNAQSITKHRWLHHSTLLYDFNPARMEYLRLPAKTPNYRMERPHAEFLCCLRDHWPSIEAVKETLLGRLRDLFQLIDVEVNELAQAAALPHRKATKRL